MKKKLSILLGLTAVIAFSTVACGNNDEGTKTTIAASSGNPICTPTEYIPSSVLSPNEAYATGTHTGSDADCTATTLYEIETPNDGCGDGKVSLVTGDSAKIDDKTTTYDATKAKWVYDLTGVSCVGLSGATTIGNKVDLKIAAGTTVVANTAQLSYLKVDQGASVDFVGTSSNPIVFTSGATVGSRKASDWGGIVIHGKAPTNTESGLLTASNTEIATGAFGGPTRNDNSGIIQYVRIEFAGYEIAAAKEFNGLFLAGVGSGTTIDHVQVHRGSDDGIEIFGGAVHLHNVVLTYNDDDGLDLDEGWMGHADHFFIAKGNDVGDHVIEFDGTGANNDRETQAIFSNFTMIGQGPAEAGNNNLLVVKSNGALTIVNSVFANFTGQYIGIDNGIGTLADPSPTAGDHFDTLVNYGTISANVTTKHISALKANYFENIKVDPADGTAYVAQTALDSTFIGTDTKSSAITTAVAVFTEDATGNSIVATAVVYPSTEKVDNAADFMPAAATGVTPFAESVFDFGGSTLNLSAIDYVGAFKHNGTNWATGWTAFPAN